MFSSTILTKFYFENRAVPVLRRILLAHRELCSEHGIIWNRIKWNSSQYFFFIIPKFKYVICFCKYLLLNS